MRPDAQCLKKGVSHAPDPSASPLVPDRFPCAHPGHRPGLCRHGGPQGPVRRVPAGLGRRKYRVSADLWGGSDATAVPLRICRRQLRGRCPRGGAVADGLRRPAEPTLRVPLRQACLGPVEASSLRNRLFKVESRLDGPPVSRLQSRPGGPLSAGLTLAIAGTRRKDGPSDGLGRVADRHRRRGQDRPRAAPAGLPGLARRPDRRRLQPAPRVVGPGRPRVRHPQGLRELGEPDRRRRGRRRRHRRLAQPALPGHPGRPRRPQARPDAGAHGDERPRGPAHARPLAGVPLPDGDGRPQPLRPDRRRLHALADLRRVPRDLARGPRPRVLERPGRSQGPPGVAADDQGFGLQHARPGHPLRDRPAVDPAGQPRPGLRLEAHPDAPRPRDRQARPGRHARQRAGADRPGRRVVRDLPPQRASSGTRPAWASRSTAARGR